jgi:hypothetical protein
MKTESEQMMTVNGIFRYMNFHGWKIEQKISYQ